MRKKVQVVMLATEETKLGGLIQRIPYYNGENFEPKLQINYSPTLQVKNLLYLKPQHLYFTSDEEIKMGDYYYRPSLKEIFRGSGWQDDDLKIVSSTEKLNDTRQIPQSFVKQYVEAGGIDEVEVEYEDDRFIHISSMAFGSKVKGEIKTNSNNEVVVHLIEEKLYSREEVILLCKNLTLSIESKSDYDNINIDNWIKENL